MTDRLIAAAADEPVSLQMAKDWLRESSTAQDTIISLLIQAAREYGENYTRRAWGMQTRELSMPAFPFYATDPDKDICGVDIEIPRPPLQSVTYVKYIDSSGVLQTLDPSIYQVNSAREPAILRPSWNNYWPITRYSDVNAVQVRYVCGYATGGSPFDQTAIPASARNWLLRKLAQLYENREESVVGFVVTPIPRTSVDGLLDSLVVDII